MRWPMDIEEICRFTGKTRRKERDQAVPKNKNNRDGEVSGC